VSEQNNEKPCLVKAGQGFSVLYKGRYLYSKYNPEKNILTAVSSLPLLPGTLVLACSPCLGTGLAELSEKLPAGCFILGCECDEELYEIAGKFIPPSTKNFALSAPSELPDLPVLLNRRNAVLRNGAVLPLPGTFRRVVRIDLSAGVQFATQYYENLAKAAEDAVGLFWKNRITLTKLGRRYSLNLFLNLSHLPESKPVEFLFRSVEKPVLVLGAGESMEQTVKELRGIRSQYYVLAADAALPSLTTSGITPDAVVCEEAQAAIADAFFGIRDRDIHIFTGITSWPDIYELCGEKKRISYFATQYDDTSFFEKLGQQQILPAVMPPLGSVGLTAVYLALHLRANENVPVYVSGLDFSYSAGLTHARGAPAHTTRLSNSIRTKPAANYGASFGYGVSAVKSKTGKTVFSAISLLSYAQTFRGMFSETKNIFDAGKSGIELSIQKKNIEYPLVSDVSGKETAKEKKIPAIEKKQQILQFYEKEEKALNMLKDILSHGQNIPETERNLRISELLTGREYLYLHFPDGYKLSLEPSFLKRVRTEIDFFLKKIHTGKQLLFP
jgi:hypothetical protein